MTPERWREITTIVEAAVAYDPAERDTFVAARCGGDAELRHEVEAMLARHATRTLTTTGPFDTVPFVEHPALAPGSRLGSYEVLSLHGSGAMGDVYLARDTVLHRKVAIKLLRADLTQNSTVLPRFEQEARAASSLNHPNIVTIYETGFAANRRFIVMEHVEGHPLTALIGEPMAPSTLRTIARQLAEALKVAHAAGIVHRDLKPANIMVRSDGYVKLLDFGVARLSLRDSYENPRTRVETAAGSVIGTPRYMAPEQIRGEPATAASDVFSLGAVLCELATGKHPSEGILAPRSPDPLHALFRRMLEPQPSARPSAADVEREIRRLESAADHGVVRTRRRRVLTGAVLLALGVSLWMAVAAYRTGRQVALANARTAAAEVFFDLRALDRDLVRLRLRDPQSSGVRELAARRDSLAQAYDDYVRFLGLYDGKSATDAAILRLARRLGEVDLDVPGGFHELTLHFVQRWSKTQRLSRVIVSARQRDLLSRLRKSLEVRGLPKELVLVALQESNFNAGAVGPPGRAGVAKGLWQLTPELAQRYGLILGPLMEKPLYDGADERHDEVKSTEAATHHLAELYSSTAAASALLTIAAYNSGQDIVRRQLEAMPDDPKVRNFWNLYDSGQLPLETRDYVMYIFSAALICEQPQLFAFPFEPIW